MQVHVRLYASLARQAAQRDAPRQLTIRAGRPFACEVDEAASLTDLARSLGLPLAEIKIAFVNGRAQPLDYPLQPGDEVGFFPSIGGG